MSNTELLELVLEEHTIEKSIKLVTKMLASISVSCNFAKREQKNIAF
ncbi:hypothetical protein MC28_F268 (plasmid) [Bacillus thuringiensis MC28]|nr:hypothetical protein MC28_F268 [Bacillus thuringiensis MC28]